MRVCFFFFFQQIVLLLDKGVGQFDNWLVSVVKIRRVIAVVPVSAGSLGFELGFFFFACQLAENECLSNSLYNS